MNTNLVHSSLNLIGLIAGALFAVDWTVFGMSATTAAQIAAGVLLLSNIINLTINFTRAGADGVTKPQPPVVKDDQLAATAPS